MKPRPHGTRRRGVASRSTVVTTRQGAHRDLCTLVWRIEYGEAIRELLDVSLGPFRAPRRSHLSFRSVPLTENAALFSSRRQQVVVIDGRGHLLGRLASIVAKQLLQGQHVVRTRTAPRSCRSSPRLVARKRDSF